MELRQSQHQFTLSPFTCRSVLRLKCVSVKSTEGREGEGETSQGGNSGQCLVFHRSANESRDAQAGNSSIVLPPPALLSNPIQLLTHRNTCTLRAAVLAANTLECQHACVLSVNRALLFHRLNSRICREAESSPPFLKKPCSCCRVHCV